MADIGRNVATRRFNRISPMTFANLFRLSAALLVAASAASASTLSDGAFGDLRPGSLVDPGGTSLSPANLAAIAAARQNFDNAVGLLEQELRTDAAYGSILAVAEDLRTYAPNDARVFWLHAIALAATGDLVAGRAAAETAAALPQGADGILPLLARAMIAYRDGRPAEAETLLVQGTIAAPDHPYAHNLLGTVRSSAGQAGSAADSFRTAVSLAPQTPMFQRNLGLAELALGRAGPALAAMNAALALDPADCLSLTATAQVQAALQKFAEAEATLRPCVETAAPQMAAVGYLIELQIRQNRFDDALTTIDANATSLPDATALRVEVLLCLARPADALATLGAAGADSKPTRLRRALAIAMNGDPAAALAIVRDLSVTQPSDAGLALIGVALTVAAGQTPDPAAVARVASDPDLAATGAAFAALSAPADQMAEIAARADNLLPGVRFVGVPASDWVALAQPANRRSAAMGLLWLMRGNDLAARAAFAAVSGEVHLVRYLDAIAATRLGDRQAAATGLAATAAAVPEFYSAQIMMGELEAGRGRLPEAFGHYRNAVAQVEDGGALMRVALIGDALNETDVAEDALRRFIALFPDSFIGYNQLAWLFIQREVRLTEALELAQQADRLQPGNASVLDNLGWVRFLNGDAAGALDTLREANRISGSSNPDIVYHLAAAEAKAGSKDAAKALLLRFGDLGTAGHPAADKARALLETLP